MIMIMIVVLMIINGYQLHLRASSHHLLLAPHYLSESLWKEGDHNLYLCLCLYLLFVCAFEFAFV